MLYSDQLGFLFVHVSKTGGSNLELALKPLSHQPNLRQVDKAVSRLGWHWNYLKYRFRQHDTAACAKRVLPPAIFERCFKFALTRNPWDWLASLYFFLRRKENHRHHKLVKSMSFGDYVDFEIHRNKRHQYPFFTDRNLRMLVNYLGRFEELESSFRFICSKIGIPRTELPRISVIAHTPYQELYDSDLREKVRSHWKTDIALLGYEFESYVHCDVVRNAESICQRQSVQREYHNPKLESGGHAS